MVEPNYNASIDFLQRWCPGGPWVLTAISLDKKSITTATFRDPRAVLPWLEQFGSDRNIYFGVNPCLRDVAKKPMREDVKELAWLHVDIDPRAGEDLVEEQERALKLLQAPPSGIPKPTVIVFSGGGYQGFWKLREPFAINGEEALYQSAARYNQALELAFGADECHNIDRIMRLPGTINRPDERKRKKGRAEALATLIEFDDQRCFNIADFQQAPALTATVVEVDTANVQRIDDVNTLPGISDLCKIVIVQGEKPEWEPEPFPSRSEALFFVCCELCRANCTNDVIYSVITDPDFEISKSVLEKGRNAKGYALRQIERARMKTLDFDRDKHGRPVPSVRNVRLALYQMGVQLYYDEFADRNIIDGLPGFGPILQDAAVDRLWLRAEEEYKLVVGKERFYTIVCDYARQDVHNPVIEYLNSREWDGKPRIDTWLTAYLGVSETPYSRAVGRLWLMAGVRRARHPGCKFDEMLVLESEQGKDKSTALQILAVHDAWFTDDLVLGADTQKQVEQTNGKWIVEAGELKGMRSRTVEFLKSYLSRTTDRTRMAYGRLQQEYPRRCVFAGTTNDDSYLQDNTGNRRFWPVRTGKIDLKALRRDRDQLWAEAAQEEAKDGASIRLDPSLYGVAAVEQEERYERDPWCDLIETYVQDEQGKVSRDDLWAFLAEKGIRPAKQTDGNTLSAAMRQLGFTREKRMRFKGHPQPIPGFWRGNKEREIRGVSLPDNWEVPLSKPEEGTLVTPDGERS